MSEAFVKKNVKLSLEFDRYMAEHPDMFDQIPNGAYVIITIKGDNKFNATSVATVKHIQRKKIIEAHKAGTGRWSLRSLQTQLA